MGKCTKKLKITGDVGVMEVSQPSPLGVRTRAAKTLALQRLNSAAPVSSAPPLPASSAAVSYLQLRSRRLEKPPAPVELKKLEKTPKPEAEPGRNNERARIVLVGSGTAGSVSVSREGEGCFANYGDSVGDNGSIGNKEFCGTEEGSDVGFEASSADNGLDCECRDRSTRESKQCNFIGDPDMVATPSSTTRRMSISSTRYQRTRDIVQRIVPTAHELEDFFACAEQQQQQQQRRVFMEKYNFDIVNDKPLPGRYEWVQVVP